MYSDINFDCDLVLSSSDKSVKVWDASSRQCVQTFYEHSDQVNNTSLRALCFYLKI